MKRPISKAGTESPAVPENLAAHMAFHKKAEAAWRKAGKHIQTPAGIPALATVIWEGFVAPESWLAGQLKRDRETWLTTQPDHWTVRLTLKLDRLVFPELMAGNDKLSEGKKLGRLIEFLRVANPDLSRNLASHPEKLWFGKKFGEACFAAASRGDADFFRDVAAGMNPATPTLKVYSFLLHRTADVERCRRVADIAKLPNFPAYSPQSFNRLCRAIGLPLRKRAKR